MKLRIVIGVIVGIGIAAIDNLAFNGEVSPILIIAMLVVSAGVFGVLWGTRAAPVAALTWAWLPLTHLAKHVLGLPDTIHPNTYMSILKLGTFSFVVNMIGFVVGLACHRMLRIRTVEKT